MNKKPYIIAFFFFMFDLFTKQIIDRLMSTGESIKVIDNFFYITYTRNTGAAWSILEDKRILLLIISVIALYLINKYMNKEKLSKIECLSYGMIMGGIVGNLIDRVILGYVIDFIHFRFFGYDYPVFNFADIFIVVGIIILMIISIRKEYHEGSKSRRK